LSRIVRTALCILLLPAASLLRAQEMPSPKLDVAVTFIAERSLRSTTPDTFWMQGGSIETFRTAVYGPVCTVVWQGSAGNCRPYADQTCLWEVVPRSRYSSFARDAHPVIQPS